MSHSSDLTHLQKRIWSGTLPLCIRLSPGESRLYDQGDEYYIQYPRLSYLPFLLPRLHRFFSATGELIDPTVPAHNGWFSFEGVELKWHYPLGLLYDLFSGEDPAGSDGFEAPSSLSSSSSSSSNNAQGRRVGWNLTLSFTPPPPTLIPLDPDGKVLHDSFMNAVKEADFVRNGSAKTVMSLSRADSTRLWEAVERLDLDMWRSVYTKLLHPVGGKLRCCPVRIYLPSSHVPNTTNTTNATMLMTGKGDAEGGAKPGVLRVVQGLVPLYTPHTSGTQSTNVGTGTGTGTVTGGGQLGQGGHGGGQSTQNTHPQPQTLGTALNQLLPTVFPSRRQPILAQAVLHGAVIPLSARLTDVMEFASYADGWVCVGVRVGV